jgi:hypothetical protein
VRSLTDSLRDDPALKREAIKLLRSKPLDFVAQCFDLDQQQLDAIQSVVTKAHAEAMARFYILILENEQMDVSFQRTTGTPEVNFSLRATNLTPSPEILLAKKKPGKPGKPGAPKPGGGTTVEGEGAFKTRC